MTQPNRPSVQHSLLIALWRRRPDILRAGPEARVQWEIDVQVVAQALAESLPGFNAEVFLNKVHESDEPQEPP